MQQEVAKVEVAVGSAHFAEVDDAGVPAIVVEPDAGGIQVAVRQVPSGDRPLPLLVDNGLQRLEVPGSESAGQPPRPPPGQVTGHELGVAGQFGAQPRQAVPAQPAEALNLDGVDQGGITAGRPHRPARLLVGPMPGQALCVASGAPARPLSDRWEAGELSWPKAPGNTGDVGPQVVRYSERPELWDALTGLSDEVWPEYIQHGATLSHYWDQLYEIFPDWQFVLYDPGDETVLAEGHTVPVAWDGTEAGLGPGIDATVTAAFELQAASGHIDRDTDTGEYWEPNIWIIHHVSSAHRADRTTTPGA
jgi:hypothetical protein